MSFIERYSTQRLATNLIIITEHAHCSTIVLLDRLLLGCLLSRLVTTSISCDGRAGSGSESLGVGKVILERLCLWEGVVGHGGDSEQVLEGKQDRVRDRGHRGDAGLQGEGSHNVGLADVEDGRVVHGTVIVHPC